MTNNPIDSTTTLEADGYTCPHSPVTAQLCTWPVTFTFTCQDKNQ